MNYYFKEDEHSVHTMSILVYRVPPPQQITGRKNGVVFGQ